MLENIKKVNQAPNTTKLILCVMKCKRNILFRYKTPELKTKVHAFTFRNRALGGGASEKNGKEAPI